MSNYYPPFAVAYVEDRVRLLKWNEREEAYGVIASAPPSSRLELSSIADDLNGVVAQREKEAAEAEAREVQLDAMVIHHEAGAERAPELHADRTGREAYLAEDRGTVRSPYVFNGNPGLGFSSVPGVRP